METGPLVDRGSDTFLEELTLLNFRQFKGLDLHFDRGLTVLSAKNGGGKTAVLDAIAVAVLPFADGMLGTTSHGFALTDARRAPTPERAMVEQRPVSVLTRGHIAGAAIDWIRSLPEGAKKTVTNPPSALYGRATELLAMLRRYADRRERSAPDLPLIAYYGTGRLWAEGRISQGKLTAARNLTQPTEAYRGCLQSTSNYASFALWYKAVALEALSELTAGAPPSPHRPQEVLAAVRAATDPLLAPTKWSRIDWDFLADEMVADHPEHGRLPVSLLSDGIRNMIAMVGDLAHRAVRLNRHHGEAAVRLTPGIVLVDEVDMHLHPAWQQTILDSLRGAFPRVQWIVTTHSPQVLSTAPRECVRVLRDDGIVTSPPLQTRGVESAEVLAEVMDVDPIPGVSEALDVAELQSLIERGEGATDTAKALRERIVAHFGARHPVVAECDRLQRWQAFKARRGEPDDRERR